MPESFPVATMDAFAREFLGRKGYLRGLGKELDPLVYTPGFGARRNDCIWP